MIPWRKWFAPRAGPPPEVAEINRLRDYVETFNSLPGRRVLDDLVRRNFVLYTTAGLTPEGRIDALRTAFHEGRRAAVLDIVHWADEETANLAIQSILKEEEE